MNIRIGEREYSVWRVGLALVGVAAGLGYGEWSHRKPKIGHSCDPGAIACLDTLTMLTCKDGTYAPSPCRGVKGCVETRENVSCDLSGNLQGDSCGSAFEGQGRCSPAGTTEVSCEQGKTSITACRGPNGCKEDGKTYSCDQSRAAIGDRCDTHGSACNVDATEMITCSDAGVFAADQQCRGAAGCQLDGPKITCDSSIATEGDVCQSGASCNVAGDAMLDCSEDTHRVVLGENCRASGGARGCTQAGGQVHCTHDFAIVGDVCSAAGGSCSEDAKAALTCKDGHYVVRETCRGRCREIDGRVGCR